MLKVAKFGGSSMADAAQFKKVRAIVEADPARRVIVVSAAGKRYKDDHKLTDLLYLCHAHKKYGVSCDPVFEMIAGRYRDICAELGLGVDIESELSALRAEIEDGMSKDRLVSRGEYFSARLMADYLGYDFLDAELWLKFSFDGSIDKEQSYENLRQLVGSRRVVMAFTAQCRTAASRCSPAAAATLPALWRRRRWTRTCTRTGRTFPASSWPIRASSTTPTPSSA